VRQKTTESGAGSEAEEFILVGRRCGFASCQSLHSGGCGGGRFPRLVPPCALPRFLEFRTELGSDSFLGLDFPPHPPAFASDFVTFPSSFPSLWGERERERRAGQIDRWKDVMMTLPDFALTVCVYTLYIHAWYIVHD
jgi:hypothetical protein